MAFDKFLALQVDDVMIRQVVAVKPQDTISKVVKKMTALGIGAVVVVDQSENIVGIFSERDLLTKVAAEDKNMESCCVSDVMTKNPQVLQSGEPISKAFLLMRQGRFRHIPIVDDHKVIGIISIKDLLEVLQDTFGRALFDVEDQG